MGLCYVVGAGDTRDMTLSPRDGDLLIAADAGWLALKERGLAPHLAVGDFDSLGAVPEGVPVVRHPVCKDETDMALAVAEGRRRGYDRFVLLGGTGGRTDHTLANLQLLTWLAHEGCRGLLLGPSSAATVIGDGGCWQMQQAAGTVSVFCQGDTAAGVTLRGLRYGLTDAVLTNDIPLGVSNAFTGAPASVRVKQGTLLIWWEPDAPENALKCLE